MKIFYLIGALFFTVMILIISFENIQAFCSNVQILFYGVNAQVPPTILFFGISLLGMMAGAFYFGFIQGLFSGGSSSEEENDEF